MEGYHATNKVSLDKSFSPRYYVGLGVESKLGTHKVSLTANYVMRNFGSIGLKAPMFTFMAGFVL
jgi:hypothetical protein